ncbi:VOC family protein [Aquincola sp. S2]|uniref:VOC family protein n=1 Tax=Pseudaquabacterium terrae TaxID=2732868 RepID=A0ABX2EHX9_9BURK|nr:VOC family protein [Aquabacterium terrae]NRF68237.1 VOC family protein [Aquabacterium terrae]
MELSAARVFVRDIVAAKRFYGQILGLPIKADGAQHGYCVFESGSADLVVESVADDAPEEDRALVGRFTGLSFKVQDASAKHQELLALGVRFTGAPEKQFWGGVLATFQDPCGNGLQIVELPAAA